MDYYHSDFLTQYRAISAKLKKRFLRKPNVAEASTQFASLAKELENQECPHYAAFCCLAVARCEHSVGNSINESENLLHAARLFLEYENLSHELECPSHSEHLQAALHAYRECIKVYLDSDQTALAAVLCLEVGQALRNLGRINESVPFFISAAKMHRNCPLDYINDLKQIICCRLKLGDFHGALNAWTEIYCIAERKCFNDNGDRIGTYAKILNEAEVTRILLLMLLQPPPYKMNPEHAKLLERYSNIDSEPVDYIDEDLFYTLQSLIMAVNEKNESALLNLEVEVWSKLNVNQADILNRIVNKYRNMLVLPLDIIPFEEHKAGESVSQTKEDVSTS